jgi:hypothetical protein
MKKEIFDDMIKLANKLDNIGLYKEASRVDRIAEVGYTSKTLLTPEKGMNFLGGTYEDHIKNYKAHVKARDKRGATNYFNGFMIGDAPAAVKDAFRAQAERIRRIYGFG